MCQDHTDRRIRHLEMIQGAITHHASCSAQVKNVAMLIGWATFLGLLAGSETIFLVLEKINFIFTEESDLNASVVIWAMLIFVSTILVTITIFCFSLDVRYSEKKKLYSQFYNMVRKQPPNKEPDFCMDLPPFITQKAGNWRVGLCSSVLSFYGALIVYYIVLIFLGVYFINYFE